MRNFVIFTDGGVRRHAAKERREGRGAFVVEGIRSEKFPLGNVTNNEAEYLAIDKALGWVEGKARPGDSVTLRCDSELIVRQLNLTYMTRKRRLKELRDLILRKKADLAGRGIFLSFDWVRREDNPAGHILEQARQIWTRGTSNSRST